MGRVDASREPSEPPAPISCPAPEVGAKRPDAKDKLRQTARGPRPSTPKAVRPPPAARKEQPPPKHLSQRDMPAEPSTGRYATVPELREEVVVMPRGSRADHRAVAKPSPAAKKKGLVPRVLKRDPGKTKLNPRDAFILSRIDGTLTVAELADLVGIGEKDAMAALERLAALDLVRL
jgi:hypothetical protein